MVDLDAVARAMISEVEKLLVILVSIAPSSATTERSFSALRRLKNWLRNSISQSRLNHLAMLHVHQELTEQIDPRAIMKAFIQANSQRKEVFGIF